jgi:hypothetical protein
MSPRSQMSSFVKAEAECSIEIRPRWSGLRNTIAEAACRKYLGPLRAPGLSDPRSEGMPITQIPRKSRNAFDGE